MSRIPCYRRDILALAWQISSPNGPMKRINVGWPDEAVEEGDPLSPTEQLREILEKNWQVFNSEVKSDESDELIPWFECYCEASYTFACRSVAEMQPIIVTQFSKHFAPGCWPAVAAYQTAKTPEGKDWGHQAVAVQSAVFYNQESVEYLDIDQDQPPDRRRFIPKSGCSAIVVNTGYSREFFCSLVLPIAGAPGNYRLVDALPAGQAHTCLMYCNNLLYTARMAFGNVDRVDVFYRSDIQAGSIVQQVQNFYPNAVMIATPVRQLPIKTCSVGIRPHAVAWKEEL